MPRKAKPPRLWLRPDEKVWVIKDRGRNIRTGCVEGEAEKAQAFLAEYLAQSYRPNAGERRSSRVRVADVLMLYFDAKPGARPDELASRIGRLNEFWGDKTVSDIIGENCRSYADTLTPSAARRDLEDLRSACNHYAKEYGLDVAPRFTMPPKSLPRERYMTRSEAARLLWECRGERRAHLRRFILIGLYTGTRSGAITSLQWSRNPSGGWVDLERGVLYRKGDRQAETKKRQPPARIPPRLLAHMRRWHRLDNGLPYVVHYQGALILRVKDAFRRAAERAGLEGVTPHILRHTRITWLVQAGLSLAQVADAVGATVDVIERHYWHHSPHFQEEAANAY